MTTQTCYCRTLTTPAYAYSECCQPLHEHQKHAETAEQLMRSRYSAFVLGLTDYIIHTTLPAQRELLDRAAIESWAKQTNWAGLEVLDNGKQTGTKRDKRHDQVEFKAYYDTAEGRLAHHELSSFVRVEERDKQSRWYFLYPTVEMTVTQKQPCICGSGLKFKRCCGGCLDL